MTMKIITDNEWAGKYDLLEEQFKADGIELIISLGDNLPTGSRKSAGSSSFFKTVLKKLAENDPSIKKMGLYEQLFLVFNQDRDGFMDNYGSCADYIRQGARFLRNSILPVITAITGNREFDYQIVLDFLAEKTDAIKTDYMEELVSSGRFDLHTKPDVKAYDSTGMLLLPYSTKPENAMQDMEECVEKLNGQKSERIVVMTHENPAPEKMGSDRKAKMQNVIETYLSQAKKVSPDVFCFCGHLDKTSGPYNMHDDVIIQPVSGTEIVRYNTDNGEYTIEKI